MIKNYLRNRILRKKQSPVPTAIMPLSDVRNAVVFLNVEDTSYDDCKNDILNYFRSKGIKVEIFFLELRRIGSGERLITSITNTILQKDINWLGIPSDEKLALIDRINPDMLILLLPSDNFTVEFIAKYCKARFKVGRRYIHDDVLDLVIADRPNGELPADKTFDNIKTFLEKIR